MLPVPVSGNPKKSIESGPGESGSRVGGARRVASGGSEPIALPHAKTWVCSLFVPVGPFFQMQECLDIVAQALPKSPSPLSVVVCVHLCTHFHSVDGHMHGQIGGQLHFFLGERVVGGWDQCWMGGWDVC